MTVFPSPAVYEGAMRHERFHPRRHAFGYRMALLLLDVDALPDLAARVPFFSVNRANLASLNERDYLGPGKATLREKLDRWLAARGEPRPARAFLLTQPRVLGFVFNPVSYWFCYGADGLLSSAVAEINSTYGEGYAYLLRRAPGDEGSAGIAARVEKDFHVSPFFAMDGGYTFTVSPPGETVRAHVAAWGPPAPEGEPRFEGFFAGRAEPLTAASLARALARHPMQPLVVLLRIHLHALRLLLKGLPVVPKPAPPKDALYAGARPASPLAARSRT